MIFVVRFATVLIYASHAIAQTTSLQDFNALHSLYIAARGADWDWITSGEYGIPWNFTSGSDPCLNNWQGVTCTLPVASSLQVVSSLALPNHNLVGSIPPSIADLNYLHLLNLGYNDLHYSIPREISMMQKLVTLTLGSNQLTGDIPSCLGQLTLLQHFDIKINYIRGPLPGTLWNLTSLQYFDVSDNALEGTFPESLLALGSLQTLSLANNGFHGHIDALDFAGMTNLVQLDLLGNLFSGPLPKTLGALGGALQVLSLSMNAFTGTLPLQWASLPYLAQLALYSNALSGPIPGYLQGMDGLRYLDLGANSLSGTLPAYLADMAALSELYVDDNLLEGQLPDLPETLRLVLLEFNAFTGTLPASTGFLTNATEFVVYENRLHGTIPDTWRNLQAMQFIDLGSNAFSGTLPDFLGHLPMAYFYANYNHFTGTIPDSFGAWSELYAILLYYNALHGTIPQSLARLSKLEVFAADYNRLTGSLEGVVNASAQSALNLFKANNNQLTGSLPSELFRLPALHTLVLGSNCFTGQLPEDVCGQQSLVSVSLDGLSSASSCRISLLGSLSSSYLSREQFHGTLLPCLFQLTNLRTLHLSGVGLSGSLPDNVAINPHLLNVALSHNRLTGTLPSTFQTKPWSTLDLSYNKLEGTLQGDFGTTDHGNSSVSLENNRLSGRIPASLQGLQRVSLLGSNLFSCQQDGSDLPQHDSGTSTYSCGSNSFESTYYAWIALLGAAIAVAIVAWRRQHLVAGAATLAGNWRRWLNASKGIIDQQTKVTAQYKTVALVNQVIRIFCRTALWCTVYMLVLLLPFYCIASAYYGTYSHEYGYTVSAAFIGGRLPMAVECVLFLGLLGVVLRCFLRHLLAFTAAEREVRSSARYLSRSVSSSSSADTSPAPGTARPVITLIRNLSIYTAFALANVLTVVGVNVAFVYVVIYQSHDLLLIAEVAVAVFKILWNEFGSSYLLRWAASLVVYEERGNKRRKDAENTRLIMIQVFVALLNNVAIPCLVVAVVSNSCFYSVFADAPTITSPYAYQLCIEVVRGECATNSINKGFSTYNPPFTYSYLCSSSFITYYAPVFVALCVIKTFVVPVGQLLLLFVHTKCAPGSLVHRIADAVLFPILKPVQDEHGSRSNRDIYRVNRLLVELTNIFGLLLTFGALFPPLGVALMVTMFTVTYFSRLALGRYICMSLEKGHADLVERVEQEGQRAGAVEVLWQSAWMLITFACLFYTLFLFDTLGDSVGAQRAFWVLVVVPSLPLCLYLSFIGYNTSGPRLRRLLGLPSAQPRDTSSFMGEFSLSGAGGPSLWSTASRDVELMPKTSEGAGPLRAFKSSADSATGRGEGDQAGQDAESAGREEPAANPARAADDGTGTYNAMLGSV